MQQYTKRDAISVVTKTAAQYEQELVRNTLLFILANKHQNVSTLEVSFEARNFLHLTGLKPTNSISATRFFKHCVDGTLSPRDFEFASDGTTQLKLEILPSIIGNILSPRMVGDYNGYNPKLYTEKLTGSVKACIGFVYEENTGYVPNTLLNMDIRDAVKTTHRVIATYRKPRSANQYTELVYKAKKVDWSQVSIPEPFTYLIP